MDEKLLREMVQRMVEEILEEGSKRDAYINSIIDAFKGAFSEFCKARYAEVNESQRRIGKLGTAVGWDREANSRILFDVVPAMRRRLKSGDRHKAFLEAIDEFRDLVPSYLKYARGKIAESFGIRDEDMIDPSDEVTFEDFFIRMENLFDEQVTSQS